MRGVSEPHWEPLPRQQFTVAQTVGIVVRHLIPLAGMLALGWSAGQFLLLSVFNICFGIITIGVVGVFVSTRQELGPSPDDMSEITRLLLAIALAVTGSVMLTAMFGWMIVVVAMSGAGSLFDWALVNSAVLMVATAAPALYRQYRDDLLAGYDETYRKRRDQPKVLVLVLTAGWILILSGSADGFGQSGLLIVATAVTALFVLGDLRPDLMRELARPAARPTARHSGKSSVAGKGKRSRRARGLGR
jgi:hypothetical protein